MAKRGRPTKYQGAETIAKVEAVAALLRAKPESFLSGCGIEQVADSLGVATSTVYEWMKSYPDFSEAIKAWETTRDATLYKLAKTLPPAIWIFMTKNMLHWRDNQAVEHSGAIKTGDKLTIHVVHTKPGDKDNGNGNGEEKK
jgi:hypothetical protein